MASMVWNDKVSVGAPSLDAQHVALIETLNELHNTLMQGDARMRAGTLLHSLLAYTRSAFAAEEALLAAASYPELTQHRLLHHHLAQQVEEFVNLYDKGELLLSLPMLNGLRDWFSNHMQKADRSYRPWLTEHSAD
ncbi:MAG: bacteriohemerythrin [Terracidiphilus sp.]